MSVIPTPHTFTVGEVVTAATMNGQRDAFRFLLGGAATYKPSFRAYMATTGQVLATGTNTTIKFNTVLEDTDSAYSTSTGIYTCATAGLYSVSYSFCVASISSNEMDMWITATSVPSFGFARAVGSSDSLGRCAGSGIVRLAAADTIKIVGVQGTGGNVTTGIGLGSTFTPAVYFAADWISA